MDDYGTHTTKEGHMGTGSTAPYAAAPVSVSLTHSLALLCPFSPTLHPPLPPPLLPASFATSCIPGPGWMLPRDMGKDMGGRVASHGFLLFHFPIGG